MRVPRFKSIAHFLRYKEQWVRTNANFLPEFFELVDPERDDLPERLTRHESVAFALKTKKKRCFDLTKQQNAGGNLRTSRTPHRVE